MGKKNLLLVVWLCMSSWVAQAQWRVTPEAGLSVVRRPPYGADWRPGVKMGTSVEYSFGRTFSLVGGLHYAQRGHEADYGKFQNESGATWVEHFSVTRHFGQLSLMAQFSHWFNPNVRIFGAIGPYVAYSLKDRYHRDPIIFSWGDDSTWDSSTLVGTDQFGDSSESVYQGHRSFDWGMTALVGVEAYRWTTKLQYDLSLGKESRWDQVRANYHTLSLSVGYRFGK